MLGRYKLYLRQARPVTDPLPTGERVPAGHATRHRLGRVFAPRAEEVRAYLEAPSDVGWQKFSGSYRELLEARFAEDRTPFDAVAELAREGGDVHLGCYCPTKKNPDVWHCHTVVALEFMRERYPDLEVRFPPRETLFE